ncbi:MAG: YlxM family DNA-binding protein [Lactovum sp.]
MTLEKTNRINLLLDIYANLLSKKQKEVLFQYYGEDFSLTEIADLSEMTKQAVSDLLKRSEKKLENFELILNLLKKEDERQKFILKLLEKYSENQEIINDLLILQEMNEK